MVKTPRSHCREGLGSIPGWGTKILQAVWYSQKKKKKKKTAVKTLANTIKRLNLKTLDPLCFNPTMSTHLA